MPDKARSLVYRRLDDDRGAYQLVRQTPGETRPNATWDARHFVEPLRFQGGRTGAADTFQAASITWAYLVDEFPADALRIGDRVGCSLTTAVMAWGVNLNDLARAPYWVTDLDLEFRRVRAPGDVDAEPRLVGVVRVTATGVRARLANLRIGAQPFSGGDTGPARLNPILQPIAAQYPRTFYTFDTTVQVRGVETAKLAAADVDRSDPVALLDAYASDSGALLFEALDDSGMVWETVDGRRNREPIVTLTASEVEKTAHWSRSLNGLVNRLTITYGPEGDRHEVTVEDAESIALYGEFATGWDSQLLYLADAQRVAQLIVGRNSRPRWALDRLDVDVLRSLPADKAAALVVADVGDLVEVAGLPAQAPYSRWLYVEGVEVTVDRHNWRLTVYLSDAGRTGAPLRWQDVDPALTWADVATDDRGEPLTWFSAAAWFDPPTTSGVYRWLDVPTDQKWWHLAPGETRDGGDARVPTWASYPDNP